jgi:hypothetical protein
MGISISIHDSVAVVERFQTIEFPPKEQKGQPVKVSRTVVIVG